MFIAAGSFLSSSVRWLAIVVAVSTLALLSACSGGGGNDDTYDNFELMQIYGRGDGSLPSVITESVDYRNFILATKATEIVSETNNDAVSVGVFDSGIRRDHQEFTYRYLVQQNYDDQYITDRYGVEPQPWQWADHGTAVASIMAGQYLGMAPGAQIVSAYNRNINSAVDTEEYRATFSPDPYSGFLPNKGVCVEFLLTYYPIGFDVETSPLWCIDYQAYYIEQLKQIASYAMPVVNFSFTIPFGHFQTGIDFNYERWLLDPLGYIASHDSIKATQAYATLYDYDFNVSYQYIRNTLSSGDLVVVNSAGNDGESLTQLMVLDWQYLVQYSTDPYINTVVNVFHDFDIDTSNNGSIEANERGITGAMLYVGALDRNGDLAWYSNTPGTASAVQSRFVVAPGEVWIADAETPLAYRGGSGTSYASAVVSGAIALLKARHPHKSARTIANALLATANKQIANYSAVTHGQGLIDVTKADEYLTQN